MEYFLLQPFLYLPTNICCDFGFGGVDEFA